MPNDSPKRRGRPPKADQIKPEAIIEAALKSFSVYGFEGASLRRIATAADVDVALISHRHGSKIELWRAVVDDIAERFLVHLNCAAPSGQAAQWTSLEVLRLTVDQLIYFAAGSPEVAMFVIKEVAQQDERFIYLHERLVMPARQVLLPIISRAIEEGFLQRIDPVLFFYNVCSAVALSVTLRGFVAQQGAEAFNEEHFVSSMKTLWRVLLQQHA